MSNETQTDKLNCSFCGKVQDEVKKLIAGPSVYICNECVDLCNAHIKPRNIKEPLQNLENDKTCKNH